MKIAGIVAEYNPFHNGHAYHIDRTRAPDGGCRATHIVAVMSGHFVQRGGPAVMPKRNRVKAALAGGVDLVLELPLPWSMSSAEYFARGAIHVLDSLECVDVLSFGSECGDTERLAHIAEVLETERYFSLLRYRMEGGSSYPAARQKAVAEIAGIQAASLLESANNTLGVEYIKALRSMKSGISVFTVPRMAVLHDGLLPVGQFASASFLRELMSAGRMNTALGYIPAACADIVRQTAEAGELPANEETAQRAVLAALRRLSVEDILRLPGISEGLQNRVYEAVKQAGSLRELYAAIKTKRYTMTRVRRIVWSGFLGIDEKWAAMSPPYIRVLGLNRKGAEILNAAGNRSNGIPVFTRCSQAALLSDDAQTLFGMECTAADLYALTLPKPFSCGTEYSGGMIRVD